MCRLASGLVLAVIVVASLGCGGGLSESEKENIKGMLLEERDLRQQRDADYVKDLTQRDADFLKDLEGMLLEERALRQEEDADFLKDVERQLDEDLEDILRAFQNSDMESFHQHVEAICMLDYMIVTLSVALEALILYLAGGELTLEEIADVFIEGVPIDGWDFSWQHNRLCGISAEGRLYLLPIPEIDK